MNMTIASHKDLLVDTLNEWDIAQQMANKRRSDMHRIIAGLPDGNEAEDAAPLTPPRDRLCRQNDRCCEKQIPLTAWEERAKNRPVVITSPQPDVVAVKPPARPTVEEKPKKTKAKRTCEADIRKAVKLVYDENLTQKEAEIVCGLPPGTLSRRKGKQIMDGYRKAWGTPNRVEGERGARRKDMENANKYENR